MLKAILLFSCLGSSIYVISSDSKKQKEKNKYILIWSYTNYGPLNSLEEGQKSFIRRNCPINNCYVTTNRSLLNGDITKFDVIAFMGWQLNPNNLPEERSPHQRYLFVTHESSSNFPVLDPVFDGFFNWTATFKLDSDIPIPYVHIQDKRGNEIGPKKKMDWSAVLDDTENVIDYPLRNKTKAAAIFVSNCSNRRKRVYHKLNKNLKKYNLSVDVYGKCGRLKCPKKNKSRDCDSLLQARYYFYLAFENSFDKDYVTEKLLRPLTFDVVPVVFGGANYRRFLPPGSYLDVRALSSRALAKTMAELIRSPESYKQYFKWQRHYTYLNKDAGYRENVCNICAKVNDPSLLATHKVYHNFRNWWHRH